MFSPEWELHITGEEVQEPYRMPTVRFMSRDRRSSSSETQDAVIAYSVDGLNDEESLVGDDREHRRPALRVEDRVVKLLKQEGMKVSAIRHQACSRGRPLS
jgi:hypothetical protein